MQWLTRSKYETKKPMNAISPKAPAWYRYFGDNRVQHGWQVPDPPSWRPRRASAKQAALTDALRGPLAPGTLAKGERYQASLEIRETVNAAIHLRRPLLVTGDPGTGKSSLIDSLAYELDLGEPLRWSVTSRSTLRDGLYSYDAIGRVQGDKDQEIGDFIELGPLGAAMLPALRPRALLIDEIDKADIDLPNDLLNVIDEGRFHIPELSRLKGDATRFVRAFGSTLQAAVTAGMVESYEFPLVVMTSNDERDFPAPFLRRCLQLKMPDPCKDVERLNRIVQAHLGEEKLAASTALISGFVARAKAGEVLATDQLLNAIQLVMGGHAMGEPERTTMIGRLTQALGRRT
jgi:MoxR-like ATPase